MKSTKYISIDKDIIKENAVFEFNLFIPSEKEKKMHYFKHAGTLVSAEDVKKLKDIKAVYINEAERAYYLRYYNQRVAHAQKKYINFEEKAAKIYHKATVILHALFSNPEDSKTYKTSKHVIYELVETVADKNFSIDSIINIAEHQYTIMTHSINVCIYALNLGTYLKFSKEMLEALGEAALLHDIGKSKINSEIVEKKGRLSEIEFTEMKKYPMFGYAIGLKLGIKNKDILMGIKYHQERMDGSGYPVGLNGEHIPYIARIIAVCDVFDALTSRRSYKEAMGVFEALLLMKTKMSKQLDVKILNKMIEMLR
ncbi:HD domain-containing protein [Sulfurimonas sp. SWIR-19]|uniref:HD-GYP domain-containing protein n=1 Tax=Sulfurimonas sp. SWIR-19 TaxID=2878390 RepID=UPI001CF3585E|nr:HD domain-containing phosphohydrolase [Sulfurimonas sp. SWIR-19]UCN01385.1 HD domain-containing protein [Sulfurimonas sp. SWIR-19]